MAAFPSKKQAPPRRQVQGFRPDVGDKIDATSLAKGQYGVRNAVVASAFADIRLETLIVFSTVAFQGGVRRNLSAGKDS